MNQKGEIWQENKVHVATPVTKNVIHYFKSHLFVIISNATAISGFCTYL